MRPWFRFGSTAKTGHAPPQGQPEDGVTGVECDDQRLRDALRGRVTRVSNVAMAITSSTADLHASMTTTVDRAKQVADAVSKVESHTAALASAIE